MSPVASLWVYQPWMDDFNNLAGWELETAFRKIIRDHKHLRLLGDTPFRGSLPGNSYRFHLLVPPMGTTKVRRADIDSLSIESLLPSKYSRLAVNSLNFDYSPSGQGTILIKFMEMLSHRDKMILLLKGSIESRIEDFIVQVPVVDASKTDSRSQRLAFICPNSRWSEADCECPTCCIRRHLERILA